VARSLGRQLPAIRRGLPREHRGVHLAQNAPSTPQVLQVASRLGGTEFGERALFTENPDGDDVIVQEVADERSEAREIVARIGRWRHEGTPAGEIAVLYRVTALSRAIEEELVREQIPYSVVGGTAFYQRKEIKDVLAYLRAAHFPRDELALRRIINTPSRGIGEVSLVRFEDAARDRGLALGEALRDEALRAAVRGRARKGLEELCAILTTLASARDRALSEQIVAAIGASGYATHLRETEPETYEDRLRNLDELAAAAAETEELLHRVAVSRAGAPVREPLIVFLERVALVADIDFHARREERISLMTLHAAKGLEFDRVIIAGVEETLIPHSRRDEPEDTDEERRLLYVGVTRARRSALLLHAAWRRRFRERDPCLPSRFLRDIAGPGVRFERCDDGWEGGGIREKLVFGGSGERAGPDWEPEEDDLVPGAWIEHDILGRGRITGRSGFGESKRITVRFEAHGDKQLVAAYAPLRIIAPPDDEVFGE
jgi:DNA helicase-2/ATP-dependent DNA helicase PcrA